MWGGVEMEKIVSKETARGIQVSYKLSIWVIYKKDMLCGNHCFSKITFSKLFLVHSEIVGMKTMTKANKKNGQSVEFECLFLPRAVTKQPNQNSLILICIAVCRHDFELR